MVGDYGVHTGTNKFARNPLFTVTPAQIEGRLCRAENRQEHRVDCWYGAAPTGATRAFHVMQVTDQIKVITLEFGNKTSTTQMISSALAKCLINVRHGVRTKSPRLRGLLGCRARCDRRTVTQARFPMPAPGERNVLITSALPYVNNEPHLGNIIGCVLSGDAFARYCRLRGYNTLYVCGTDEYGTATETKALEEGVDCQTLCNRYHDLHRQIYEHFDIAFDHFGRTTTEHQTRITQDIFSKLRANGYIFEEEVFNQLYCESCTRFLADRYVTGTCPHCGSSDARGDQCDGCGQLLQGNELIAPKCKLDGHTPTARASRHLFLDLPKLEAAVRDWIDSEGKHWPPHALSTARKWLSVGLRARCITRDLHWGTKVPVPGFENKVFYVWFDACIGYASITASAAERHGVNVEAAWRAWWQQPKDVELYQFMGKDNVPFHTVMFPATQLGTREPWTMVRQVAATEHLQYEGGAKFSKSRGVGVFGSHVRAVGKILPIDTWRYYLFMVRPETGDSQFSWTELIMRHNTELLNNLGNLANRTAKFIGSQYDGVVPSILSTSQSDGLAGVPLDSHAWFGVHPTDAALVRDINDVLENYVDALENAQLRRGLQLAMAMAARGNQYLQEGKLSKSLLAEDPARCDVMILHALHLLELVSAAISPYMPGTATRLASILGEEGCPTRLSTRWIPTSSLRGRVLPKPTHLFRRVDLAYAEVFRQQFGGDNTVMTSAKS